MDGSWGTEGIQAVYTGRYHVSVRPPDFKPAEATPQVIRDQAAFDAFVKTIPTEQIQKKQPAPPSDDPLLKSPRFDWSKQMVLVGFRTDSMYGKVVFKGIKQEGGRLRVKLDLPDLGPEAMGAQPHGVGVYSAIVVERFEGEVVFE